MTRRKQWTEGPMIDVPRPLGGDEKLWWVHSLGLTINRHCAECWTDDEVSQELNRMAAITPLPFRY